MQLYSSRDRYGSGQRAKAEVYMYNVKDTQGTGKARKEQKRKVYM